MAATAGDDALGGLLVEALDTGARLHRGGFDIPVDGDRVDVADRIDEALVAQMRARIEAVWKQARSLSCKPRVYFEEWGSPMIPAGGWEAECLEVAGATNVFPFPAHLHSRDRVVSSEDVIQANPDIILISWPGSCGRIRPQKIKQRPGWKTIEAVRNDRVFVIDDRLIVRPGPRIVEGLELLSEFVRRFVTERVGGN